LGRIPPIRRGGDMRCEPADELAACSRIVDAQEHVCAEVRCRPRSEDCRLDFLQVECRCVYRRIGTGRFIEGQHKRLLSAVRIHSGPDPDRTIGLCRYPTLSSSSSTALPTFSSLRVSATVRFGLATYQPSAVIWWLAIQSPMAGSCMPLAGYPSMLLNNTSRECGIFVEKSAMYGSQSPSYVVANNILVSLSRNTKRMSCKVPTLSAPWKLPPNTASRARNRFAPPGANFIMPVSSDTLPRRSPVRPALVTLCCPSLAAALSSAIIFSSPMRPTSGAS